MGSTTSSVGDAQCHDGTQLERPDLTVSSPSSRHVWRVVDLIEEETPSNMLDIVLRDARVFTDFVLHVKAHCSPEVLLDLWALDIALRGEWVDQEGSRVQRLFSSGMQETFDACVEVVARLTPVFEQYMCLDHRLRRFNDPGYWPWESGTPSQDVMSTISHSHGLVGKDHDVYAFSIAAMIGMHVAIVCSDVVRAAAQEAAGGPAFLRAAFAHRFPHVDFEACKRAYKRSFLIPPGGSAYSPAGMLPEEFSIDEMCPDLFAEVRSLCGIHNDDFFESACRTDFAFIEFGANSKSKELFFFSHDEKYLLKTMTDMEAGVLASMLPGLVNRMRADRRTMLGKYCGGFQLHVEDETRSFFIMRNVKTHCLPITCSYDIKGSEMNRTAAPSDSVGKDNDFWQEIGVLPLDPQVAQEVARVHRGDMELLRDCRVMDFSLLIQMHDRTGHLRRKGIAKATTKVQMQKESELGRFTRLKMKLSHFGIHGHDEDGDSSQVSERSFSTRSEPHFETPVPPGHGPGHGPGCSAGMHRGNWDPSDGTLVSSDGQIVYSLGLIDLLVPFDWYNPRGQYVANTVLSCGHPDLYSRVPPDIYCHRQVAAVHELCGLEAPEED